MAVFEDITLAWNEVEYVIKADRVMALIGRIEEVVTLAEVFDMLAAPKTMRLSKIAAAYATALRYAGAHQLTTELVYGGMFKDGGAAQSAIIDSLVALLGMMVPASALKEAAKVTSPGKDKPAAPRSSRKRSN